MGSKSAIGIGNGICFKQVRNKGRGSYIDPLVRDSLVGVWIADQNTNESPTRNIIKNTIKDKGGDLELLNFGYKLNSGYGKYEEDFTDTTRWEVVSGVNKKPYELQVTTAWNPKIDWIALIKGSGDLKSVSLNVSGIPNEGTLFFYYGTDSIQLYNGNNKVTLSGVIPQTTSGYRIIKGRDLDWSNLVITQIPSFEGALVTDRAVIKNLVDSDNPFVISNAAYEGMSGYNGYPVVFGANKTWKQLPTYNSIYSINDNKIHITKVLGANRGLIFSYVKQNDQLLDITEIPSFKIKVSGLKGDSKLRYSYIKTENAVYQTLLDLDNGIHKLPKSLRPTDSIVNESWIGFTITPIVENEITFDCDITIEVLPEYEGAFVTDGKDDLITSTKTVKEMLGGSSEITVVSMMLNLENEKFTYTNQIRPFQNGYIRNNVISNTEGKCGIYGYKITDISDIFKNRISINDILGDRKDYSIDTGGTARIDGKFSVEGYCFNDGTIGEVSQVAWYWTFIAKRALTTDEINQVIAYYNLDRTLKPDILCNTIKQGITNENHAEFGDKLIDFSGNGRDIQLNNIAWKGDSGIGKYAADFTSWTTPKEVQKTSDTVKITTEYTEHWVAYLAPNNTFKSMKVLISGIPDGGALQFFRTTADGDGIKMVNGINEIPEFTNTAAAGFYIDVPLGFDWSNLVIEQIPSHAGALCLDGVNDFGKVTGMPIYKDYTVVADYERLKINIGVDGDSSILSKSESVKLGAFIFNTISINGDKVSYSFGHRNIINTDDTIRKIFYQSKYINDGQDINIESTFVDSDKLWLGTYRDSDYHFIAAAIYSLMSFPYSMSEFLLERQLKKYKLGTLYPDMVEWRPQVNINVLVVTPPTFSINNGSDIITNGQYIPEGTEITIRIFTATDSSVSGINEVTAKINGVDIELSPSGNKTYYGGKFIISSKQKIDITIDEYIRFEDIVQPYPAIVNLSQDGKSITWGDKLKVGSEVTFVNHTNLLPEIYTISGGIFYNGTIISGWNTPIVVAKSMVFTNVHGWKLNTTEPHAIYSPQKLNIPNSSLKILGYVPDLTGKGNHGKLNNFAYTEDSGVAADGSIKFDGIDDHITIPTLAHGGKCMMMKVNWNKDGLMLYDQRKDSNPNSFAIYIPNFNSEDSIAYSSRNDGKTYIDGVLNTSVKGSQLKDVTHNITITNSNSNNDNTVSPAIGSNAKYNTFYAQMVLYEFMLLPDVPDEEEIKELNEVMSIEGGYVESPDYY